MQKIAYTLTLAAILLSAQPGLYSDAADVSSEPMMYTEPTFTTHQEPQEPQKQLSTNVYTETYTESASTPAPAPQPVVKTLTPFTGKITKNKVRLRLQPSLDAGILRELNSGDLVIVTGETDEFYAVEPTGDIKAYIYRTYVLDGVVEGTRVNVRLEPDTNAPVIAQMNSGDPVPNGTIYPKDKKWIEFTAPASTRFYVAKEFVTKIGDKSTLTNIKRRREEINAILSSSAQTIQTEMRKPFDQIHIEETFKKLNKAISEYTDFPEEIAKLKTLLSVTQESYLQKKLADMEAKMKSMSTSSSTTTTSAPTTTSDGSSSSTASPMLNNRMAAWQANEERVYNEWAQKIPNAPSMDEFYQEQKQNAVTLQGVIEPYDRPVRNKPGDYVLVTQANHMPIAYLYSTQVNLQDKVGKMVVVHATSRGNNNFAFPAYFVLSVEE